MNVKMYRYRIQPDQIERFLDIQKRADWIYRKHINYRITHFQSRTDPAAWVETHWFPDADTAAAAAALAEREPELSRLFAEFVAVLDPADPRIKEEVLDDRSIR